MTAETIEQHCPLTRQNVRDTFTVEYIQVPIWFSILVYVREYTRISGYKLSHNEEHLTSLSHLGFASMTISCQLPFN